MQKLTVTLAFEDEKLRALETYLKMENSSVQKKLEEAMAQLYEQLVPKDVQKFIDALSGAKPRRPASTAKPQATTQSKADIKAGAAT